MDAALEGTNDPKQTCGLRHSQNRMVMGSIVVDHEEVTRTFAEGPGKLELVMIYEVQKERIVRAWTIAGAKTLDVPS
jgi:hypothetical protein